MVWGELKRLHAFNIIMGREMKVGRGGVRNKGGKGDRFFPLFSDQNDKTIKIASDSFEIIPVDITR